MANNDEKKDELRTPERRISAGEQEVHFDWDKDKPKAAQEKEISPDEKAVADELRREIELMDVEPELMDEAKKKAKEIEFLDIEEKVENLMQIARERGIIAAIKTAKEVNDPAILDTLHDVLAKNGYYKTFKR